MWHVRSMSLGQRSRSHLAFKVFAFYSDFRPITSSCVVGFEKILRKKSSRQDGVLGVRTMSLDQRSRSQLALKFCAFKYCVPLITSLDMVGFENYFAEMIIRPRQCVACKSMSLDQGLRLQ